MSIKLSISKEILGRHPDLSVQGIVVSGLRNLEKPFTVPSSSEIRDGIASMGISIENLASSPLVAEWRNAIALCGLKPSRYKSSVEALSRRWLSRQEVTTSVCAVDLYCAVSVLHMAPLGAYDLDRLPSPDVALRLADPLNDCFVPLGGRPEDMPLTEDLAVYASGSTVLCYAFNHRDSRETCLTEGSERAVFLGEAVTRSQGLALDAAIEDLERRLASSGVGVLSRIRVP